MTLACVVLLVVNDWVLKRHMPGAVTGKLSDLAGLAFAPVVLSSAIGLLLHGAAALGARGDPARSRRRRIGCLGATGVGFAAVKLAPWAADGVERALGALGRPATIVLDRTDLLALPALAIAWWVGRDELRRVPLGRPSAIHRLGRPAEIALADTGASPALVRAVDEWEVSQIDELLQKR